MNLDYIINDNVQFVIDEDLRTIAVPSNGVVLGVVGDKNTNRVNFQMPRYYNGFDMSGFTTRIHYINANKESNIYQVTDMTVEGDTLYFTWLVDADVVAYQGRVTFVIKMIKLGEDGVTKIQEFNSTLTYATVLEGLDVLDDVPQVETEDLIAKVEATALSGYAKQSDLESLIARVAALEGN